MKPSSESVETSRDMGHVLGQGRSSRLQQTSDPIREKIPSPRTEKGLSSQDKDKAGYPFGRPYLDPNRELKKNAITKQVVESKSSENDELVKHMSNVPGFLKKVEKENTIQEKALNFGVLDWKRLEKWKYNERMPGKYPKKAPPTSNSLSPGVSGPPKMVPNLRKQPLLYSGKQPMPHGSRFSSPSRQLPTPRNSHLNSLKEEKYVKGIPFNGKETRNQEVQAAKNSMKDNGKMKDSKNGIISDKEPSSSGRYKHKSETRLNDEVRFTSECCPADPQIIVPLVPEHFEGPSYLESSQVTESRTSLDGQLAEAIGNRLSGFFSPQELYSGELSVDIPHSCPLPSQAIDLDIATSSCPGSDSATFITSEGKCSMMHEKTNRHSSSESSHKWRPPSPTSRFSFNLGKMSRSFSFKESSVPPPQLSSTYTTVKSGPAGPEASSGMKKFERDKANTSSKGRSSPLRRLLDSAVLKYKGPQSSETIRPPSGSSNSMTFRTMSSTKGPSRDRKSTFQSLLQLSSTNGLPFFKLVVDNSNDMLAAVVKRMPTSGKVDNCMIYTFYSVREIRKKSMNWMGQGSKSNKNCSLDHNIVGQMKISSSSECDVRECVLYGIDDPGQEIAAIVVTNSNDEKKNPNGTVVILPGGVHGVPIKGAPSPLISRWRSGGSCDCGGWDVGCKLRILTDYNATSSAIDRVNLFVQGGELKGKRVFSLEPFSNGYYSIELEASISLLEAFATSVAYLTCRKMPEIIDTQHQSDVEFISEAIIESDGMKRGKSTLQGQVPQKFVTCPPLSPAGRI